MRRKIYIIAMAMLLLHGCFQSIVAKGAILPNIEDYLNASEEHDRILQKFKLNSWTDDTSLNCAIESIAIGPSNQIVIMSNSSENPNQGAISTEYSVDGEYILGLCHSFEGNRGNGILFFSDNGEIGYIYRTIGRIVCVVGEMKRSGFEIVESYSLPSEYDIYNSSIVAGSFYKKNGIDIFVHNDAEYCFSEVEPARVVIASNTDNGQVTVYDHHDSYLEYQAGRALQRKYYDLSISVVMSVFFIVYHLYKIKDIIE